MSSEPRTEMSREMLADERFHSSACDRAVNCSCGMTQNLLYVEDESWNDALREVEEAVGGLRSIVVSPHGRSRSKSSAVLVADLDAAIAALRRKPGQPPEHDGHALNPDHIEADGVLGQPPAPEEER